MNIDEKKSVHDFDVNLICEYFLHLERQGHGSPEMTLKALSFTGSLTAESRIADFGCGTGGQTMLIAQNLPGNIEAIDLSPAFIDSFNVNAATLNFSSRVKGIVGSMNNLPYGNEELDLIWSESAIYGD